MIINIIKNYIKKQRKKSEWRRRNPNNSTTFANNFNFDNVKVGAYTYGSLKVLDFGTGCSKLTIGAFCSIASNVVFNLSGDHYLNHLSTFPFKAKALNGELNEAISKGDIIIEDDVWIGQNAVIMSGVHVGQGAVIGAGAIVSSDVPPYAVVGGVPAKVIKYRFNRETIDYLLTLDYGCLTKDSINENIDMLYTAIDRLELNTIKEMYSWLPKKDH